MKSTADKKGKWRRGLRAVAWQLLLLAGLVFVIEGVLGRHALGVAAPPIEAPTLEVEHFSLQQFRGHPAVIHFWATWCPVCELEQAMVDTLAAEVPMITVAMQSGDAVQVRDYLQQQGVNYPVVNDPHGTLAKRYGVKAVPASFIVDGTGQVRFVTRGYTTNWGLRLRLWLAGLFSVGG